MNIAEMEMINQLSGFSWLLWLCPIPLAWFFGIPLLILATLKMEAHPEIQRVDHDVPLPQEVKTHFYQAHESFDRLGYQNEGTYFLPEPTANVKAILVLFVNRQKVSDAASIVFYAKENGQWKIQAKYTEISTAFPDETAILTGNQDRQGAFPTKEGSFQTIHPYIQGIEKLVAAHDMFVREHSRGRRPELRLDAKHQGNAIDYLRHGISAEYANAKQVGILNFHEGTGGATAHVDAGPYQPPTVNVGDYYTPTFTGAYRMTWNELWPTKPLLFRRRVSRDRRLLKEAGWTG